MEARSLFGIVAIWTAAAAAFLGVLVIARRASSRSRAQAARTVAVSGGVVVRVMRNGIPPFIPVGRMLLKIRYLDTLCFRLSSVAEERGYICSRESAASIVCSVALVLFCLGFLRRSLALGVVFVAMGLAVTSAWVTARSEKRREHIRDALPDALRAMSACFHAGFSLSQTFAQLEKETKGPLGHVFGKVANALGTGSTAREALELLRQGGDIDELSFVAVALEVQHQSGGSMQHVLDATGDMLKSELELRRSLRVHTAQARLSARVVVAVTIGLLAILMTLTDGFLTPFFESPLGMAMLAAAIGMQVIGIFVVRKMLHVEVD